MPASRVIKKCLPISPGRNSHFTIRHNGDEWWVFCEAPDGTLVPADLPHVELVSLVNELKTSEGIAPGGGFSINEHSQVVARMTAPAGYKQNSIFVVDTATGAVRQYGQTITFQGGLLDPTAEPAAGDPWVGPLCGATYRFAAPGNKKPPNHNIDEVWTEIEGQIDLLSTHTQPSSYPPTSGPLAAFLAALRLRLPQGGRFRVNEQGRAFTANGMLYIGRVPLNSWFAPLSVTS